MVILKARGGGFLAQAQEVFQLSRVDGMKTLCFQVTFTKSAIFWARYVTVMEDNKSALVTTIKK
jgi:hypothetical protein